MSLALVIPVRNDQERLSRLLQQAAGMGIFDQVVICDDGSDVPVDPYGAGFPRRRIKLLRNTQAQGPGRARNRALTAVRSRHMIYFDSDDLFTEELPLLWEELAGEEFDFCLFRHHDSRSGPHGWGQLPTDDALWRAAGVGHGTLFEAGDAARLALAQTANYPWNKIYRTGFLRKRRLGCSEVLLHEDVSLHWLSFFHARRILVSDRVGAVHIVARGGERMTNRSGEERFCVFEPLGEVAETLAGPGAVVGLQTGFFHFVAGLLDWVRSVLDPELYAEMDRRTGQFLQTHLSPRMFDQISRADPALALRLVLQMAGGRTPC